MEGPAAGHLETPVDILDFLRHQPEVKKLPKSFVHLFMGQKGSGKSAAATYFALRAFLAGRPVFYNPEGLLRFGQYVPLLDIINLEDELDGAFIWLDEIQESLNRAFQAATGPQMILAFIRQVRKRGATLALTSNAPGELPGAINPQVNFHYHCLYREQVDTRTGVILRSIISLQVVDTQRAYGPGKPRFMRGRKIDDRKRFWGVIKNPHRLFPLYDTLAITDQLAIRSLTPQKIKAYREAKALPVSADQVIDLLRNQVIPDLVASGANAISTADLARYLSQNVEISTGQALSVSVEYLGRICSQAGLTPFGRKGTRWWRLPPANKLELWKQGLYLAERK